MGEAVHDRLKIPSILWATLKRLGVDRADVVRRAALPISVIRDEAAVSTEQSFRVWRAIEAASADDTIGLRIATTIETGVMQVGFIAAYHARDFRDALDRVARFKRLCVPEDVAIEDREDRTTVTISWPHAKDQGVPPSLTDATMASLIELGRRGTGRPISPSKVEVTRAERLKGRYEKYFGCSVRFRAAVDRLTFRREDLDQPFPHYNKELLEVLLPDLDRRLGQDLRSGSLAEQIRWVLRRRLTAGRPDVHSVATELAMSTRSLQRRLTEDGLSFQELLNETRHQLAREHLADPTLEIIEVAYMLGYEDQNSFFRAFRQWEDRTPSEWRARHVRPSGRRDTQPRERLRTS
jgi:AraC-like DNA-binding protein